MKIKEYLDIIDRLPQLPFQKEKVEFCYLENDFKIGDTVLYNKIEFIQYQYVDRMNKPQYRWKVVTDPKIDYKVDDIYIKSTNNLIFASLIDLTYRYNFKQWTPITSNITSCYINFRSKMWALSDSKCDKFYCIDDDNIIENIFMSSLNEYPNGVPIIWEDL